MNQPDEAPVPAEAKITDYKKKVIVGVGGLFLLIVGLVAGMYLSQQNQNPQSKAYSEGVLLPKPIAEWKFDEGSGNKVADSAKNHDGKWNGTGSHWADGKFAKAGTFNGTDDYAVVKNDTTLDFPGTKPFSFTAWVKPGVDAAGGTILGKFNGGVEGQYILYLENGKLGFHREVSPYGQLGTTVMTAGQWYHVAAVYDGVNKTIYVNGLAEGNQASGSVPASTVDVTIGARYNSGIAAGLVKETIDQVRVYDYALTGAQVLKDMGVEQAVPQTTTTISDDFNGASLDTGKWNTWKSPAGTTAVVANQENGVFRVRIPTGQTVYSDGVIEWKQEIQGDFEAVADLKIESSDNKNTSDTFIAFHDMQEEWKEFFLLALRREEDRIRLIANIEANDNWGTEFSTILGGSSVKVKMQRIGNTANFFYDVGFGYVLLGSKSNVFGGNGRLILDANTWSEFPAVTATFDNFFARVNLAQQPPACPAVQGPEIKDVTGIVQTKAPGSFTWLQKTGGTPVTVRIDCGTISWTREQLAGDGPSDIPMAYADVKVGHRIKIQGGFFETQGGSVIQASRVQDMSLRVIAVEGKISSTASGMLTLNSGKRIQVDNKAGCRSVQGTVFTPARCVILAVKHDIRAVGVYDDKIKTMVGPAAAGIWTKITDLSVTP